MKNKTLLVKSVTIKGCPPSPLLISKVLEFMANVTRQEVRESGERTGMRKGRKSKKKNRETKRKKRGWSKKMMKKQQQKRL